MAYSVRLRVRSFRTSAAGATVVLFALCLPVLLGLVAAGVEYARMLEAGNRLQVAVDEAALLGANELVVATMTDQQITSSVAAKVKAVAATLGPGLVVASQIRSDERAIAVTASVAMPLVFARVLNVSSQTLNRHAAASLQGESQLCLLTLDSTDIGSLQLSNSAKLTAPQCSADSNSSSPTGLAATGSAYLHSSRICTAGGYFGNSANFSPMPKTGCPVHPDPLKSVTPPSPDLANCTRNLNITASTTLSPGTYCGGLTIRGSANVTLSPGVYIVNGGDFHLKASSQIHGQNVAIYFNGATGTFKADPQTTIDLTAPKTGALAGFLIYEDPTAQTGQDFHISSVNAHNLLGTIYAPQGNLTVDSGGSVAEQSAYTVIVTRKLAVSGTTNLTLNAMYSSTDVPVPSGVGPGGATYTLTN